jgi:hypothetical protein
VIASYKHSSLFGLVVSDEGKKFYNIDIILILPITLSKLLKNNIGTACFAWFQIELLDGSTENVNTIII